MNDSVLIQHRLFQEIKTKVQNHISLPETLSEVLNISLDSAYRRIRGEKLLDLSEINQLCHHFKLSLDPIFQIHGDGIVFYGRAVTEPGFSFELWLKSILAQVERVAQAPGGEMFYMAKDIPLFHHFQFPELAAFKYLFWRKTISREASLEKVKFSISNIDPALNALGKKITLAYYRTPCTEIWNIENINSTLRQIRFYEDTGVFENKSDALQLYQVVKKELQHIEQMCEHSVKFLYGENPSTGLSPIRLFVNEVILGDNIILGQMGETDIVYLNHGVLNYLVTQDPGFCNLTRSNFSNIEKRSALISGVNEKERVRFFGQMIRLIDQYIDQV